MTREQAIKWVKFVHDVLYEDKDEEIREALNMAIEALKKPQGEWIVHTLKDKHFECDQCHKAEDKPTHFCPNCGADMRGKDNER